MPARLWIATAGGIALAIGGTLLAFWASGDPDLVKIAAWRGKTNACVALVLAAVALRLRSSERPLAIRLSRGLAIAVSAIGGLTAFEYAAGVDLGIDDLLAHDWPFVESVLHPNRMSPNAAASFLLLGAIVWLTSAPARLAALGQ